MKPFTIEDIKRLYNPAPNYVPPTYWVSQQEYDALTGKWPHMAPYLNVYPKLTLTSPVRLENGSYYVTAKMEDTYGADFFRTINDFSISECAGTVEP